MRKWLQVSAFLPVLGSLGVMLSARADLNSSLTIEIGGLSNQDGQVCVSVFSSSQGFPGNNENAIRGQCTEIVDTPVVLTFSDLEAGSYAVAVIHDENSDRTLNRNILGIPTEGFGFSRNPTITAGPPQFNDTSVVVAGQNTSVQIQLKYLL